jgi:hypothetical protein
MDSNNQNIVEEAYHKNHDGRNSLFQKKVFGNGRNSE